MEEASFINEEPLFMEVQPINPDLNAPLVLSMDKLKFPLYWMEKNGENFKENKKFEVSVLQNAEVVIGSGVV